MPQSLSRVWIHLVYSTKHREPLIPDAIKPELHAYCVGVLQGMQLHAAQIGGTQDHVHVLTQLSRTLTIAEVVEEIKKATSKWMKTKGPDGFAWQGGYGVFSVSESKLEELIDYIRNQDEHHRHRSFQEEFRLFCQRHKIALDERYAWD